MSAFLVNGQVEAEEFSADLTSLGVISIDGLKWSAGALQLQTRPARKNPESNPPPAPLWFGIFLSDFLDAKPSR